MRYREITEGTIKLRGFSSNAADDETPAAEFDEAFASECTTNPLNHRALVWNNEAVVVIRRSPSMPHDNVELADIKAITPGGGKKALQRLCDLADKYGVTLYLYAKGYADVPTKKLAEIYKRFGFSDFGKDLRYLDDVAKIDGEWEDHEGVEMERTPR